MNHITDLLETYMMRREDDELETDDDEFDFDLDNDSDMDVDMDMGGDDDDAKPDMDMDDDLGDDDDDLGDDEVGDTEDRLNDLEDKVTDILSKLSQVIAQTAVDDLGGEEDDDLDADLGDDDLDADPSDVADDDLDLDAEEDDVNEYEDNLPVAGDPDDDDYEKDGGFDIGTYGNRGGRKSRRFTDKWKNHRINEDDVKAAMVFARKNPKATYEQMLASKNKK